MAKPSFGLYEQQTAPRGGDTQVATRPVNLGSGIGAKLAQAGQGLTQLAEAGLNAQRADLEVQQIQERRAEEDGRVYAAKAIAEFRRDAGTATRETFDNAPNGYQDATVTVGTRLNELRTSYAEAAPTPVARRFIEQSIDVYTPMHLDGVAEAEQRGREKYHVDTLASAIDTDASTILVSPEDYASSLARTRELIGGMEGIGAEAKRTLLEGAEQSFANAAVSGLIDRNPRSMLARLKDPEADGPVANLTASQRAQYIARAENEIERRNAAYRSQVLESVQAATAMWELGLEAPNAPTVDAVRTALGPDRAIAYEAQRAVSSQYGGLTARPSSELAVMANNATPGTDVRTAVVGAAQRQAAARILDARAKDPMQFAVRHGMAQDGGLLEAAQSGDWDAFNLALRSRGAAAQQNAARWGSPSNPLTAFEAQTVGAQLQALPSQSRAAFFQRAGQSLGVNSPAYRSFLGQIAQDNPVTAYAGYAQSMTSGGAPVNGNRNVRLTGERAGRLIFRGEELLRGTDQGDGPKPKPPISLPAEDQLRASWDRNTRGAYATPEASAGAYQAYRAAYAALSEEAGDVAGLSVPQERSRLAVAAATGGIAEINGRPVTLPFMSRENFLNVARRSLGTEVAGYAFDDLEFQAAGSDRYRVLGPGGVPVIRNGQPVTLTVTR